MSRPLWISAALIVAPLSSYAEPQCNVAPQVQALSPSAADVVVSRPNPDAAKELTPFPATDVARMPALRNVTRLGAQIYELPSPPELEGYRTAFAVNGGSFQIFYVPPHGGAVIRGIVQGSAGENLTLAQTRAIPGVVPSVEIRDGAPLVEGSLVKTAATTTHGLWGQERAPLVYMFMDPLCGPSLRALQVLKPAVESGRIRVAVVPISINDHENGGRSTPAAAAMLSTSPADMAQQWLSQWQDWATKPLAAALPQTVEQLRANRAAARAISLRGTPTLVWRKKEGSEGRLDGAPRDLDGFLLTFGG